MKDLIEIFNDALIGLGIIKGDVGFHTGFAAGGLIFVIGFIILGIYYSLL